MDNLQEPSRDSLALARKHVRALTDGGVSRQALLRALLEQEEASNLSYPSPPCRPLPQPQLKSNGVSRPLSFSQVKSQSHWSVSTAGHAREEDERPPSSDQLSTSTGNSAGSRNSFTSTHTNTTTLSSQSSTITQFPGPELPGSRSAASGSTRAYWCTSCDTEFKRKFDWKRHEDEFHERYKKYPCPDCNRVFWGANTFNQHHKTRHNCKTCPHADKVIKYTRKKRAWACGFCAAFLPSMDRYVDHIGLHYEAGRTKAHWYHSNVIYGLLHQPGVNTAWKNIIGTRFSHIPKDQQPRYGWDPKTTGRKQGFLENETAGNLQDLLEFFNPTKDDPGKVARLAFDLAELTPANQAQGRSSVDLPDKSKVPPPPPPAPKREKSAKRSASGTQRDLIPELPPPPAAKDRPVTQWPGILPSNDIPKRAEPAPSVHSTDTEGQTTEFDVTAVPRPLFANSISPPPPHAQPPQYAQVPPPAINISNPTDPPPYVTPTTPFPGLPRDTVVDILTDYMAQDHMAQDQMPQPVDGTDVQHITQQHLHNPPPWGQYEDWNSICGTLVDSVASPTHGQPLALAPPEQVVGVRRPSRRSDVWASTGDHTESMYVDDVIASYGDLPPQPPPPPMQDPADAGRRSDVWAATVDYEGMGYENEVAGPPGAHTSWL